MGVFKGSEWGGAALCHTGLLQLCVIDAQGSTTHQSLTSGELRRTAGWKKNNNKKTPHFGVPIFKKRKTIKTTTNNHNKSTEELLCGDNPELSYW